MKGAVRQAGRALAYLAVGAAVAVASYLFIALALFTAVLTLLVVGAGVLPETVLLLRRVATFKRGRVAEWSGREVPEAYLPLGGPLRERVRTALGDPGTWRDLRWLVAHFAYGWLLLYAALLVLCVGAVVDGLWCGLLRRPPVLLPVVSRLADLDAGWSRALLGPAPGAERLAARVTELTESRAGAVAAHGAELRRIERDLHDGTQARLVALSMRIGLARRAQDPEAARRLLDDAQDQAEAALAELRHVVRGIHPPILTDRGLVGAVRALAAASGLDVAVRDEGVESGGRAPAAVEAAAYFVIAEALTNAAKHSGGTRADVQLERGRAGLRVAVRDSGRGGADERGGSGLLGMRRRVAALDGNVRVSSPVGGPTVIEVELPCVW
ncbi:sensor histidine kinase [Streptomyces xanthii]|uniref:histidine kinase n=1 Tax=Streptomyces xanthii TaxID=2768069 RepID=A0A7H1BJG5_9ACTN|nr:sensor domain-containing protein [Streptomyces xanthii]QNS08870.1 sensor domain-containing protein [Streptomyces xanthii]